MFDPCDPACCCNRFASLELQLVLCWADFQSSNPGGTPVCGKATRDIHGCFSFIGLLFIYAPLPYIRSRPSIWCRIRWSSSHAPFLSLVTRTMGCLDLTIMSSETQAASSLDDLLGSYFDGCRRASKRFFYGTYMFNFSFSRTIFTMSHFHCYGFVFSLMRCLGAN